MVEFLQPQAGVRSRALVLAAPERSATRQARTGCDSTLDGTGHTHTLISNRLKKCFQPICLAASEQRILKQKRVALKVIYYNQH